MNYIKQLFIILLISFVGEVMSWVIPLPVPASIYGIIIMFLCLELKIFPLSAVKEVGGVLTVCMQVMFIPAAAGLIGSWDILRASWLQYLILIAVSTVAVMVVSGRVTQYLVRKGGERNA